jgi:hypothetical protein
MKGKTVVVLEAPMPTIRRPWTLRRLLVSLFNFVTWILAYSICVFLVFFDLLTEKFQRQN